MTEDQFRVIAGLLLEIRDALVLPPVAEPVPEGCPHPEEKRIDFRSVSDRGDHWVCGVCRAEYYEGQTAPYPRKGAVV